MPTFFCQALFGIKNSPKNKVFETQRSEDFCSRSRIKFKITTNLRLSKLDAVLGGREKYEKPYLVVR